MNEHSYGPRSILLSYLPGIYQESEERERQQHERADLLQKEPRRRQPFLDEYLLPFQKILLEGDGTLQIQGLERQIDAFHLIFLAGDTALDFLPWLASWAAFSLRADLSEKRKRLLVESIFSLYPIRGTRGYLERLLDLILDVHAAVRDSFPHFQISRRSTVGVDSFVGGGPPHYFRVTLRFRGKHGEDIDHQCELAREVIELAKPAHTLYDLEISHPRMQINRVSTVGVDTLL
jgi:phage tail-like protein